jgi:hypothetical protein
VPRSLKKTQVLRYLAKHLGVGTFMNWEIRVIVSIVLHSRGAVWCGTGAIGQCLDLREISAQHIVFHYAPEWWHRWDPVLAWQSVRNSKPHMLSGGAIRAENHTFTPERVVTGVWVLTRTDVVVAPLVTRQVTEPWFQWRCFRGLLGCARWSRPMWHRSCNSSMIIF